MAINLFSLQTIQRKLLVGTLSLAVAPVLVTSFLLGREALFSARDALQAQARDALVAQRDIRAAQISDYFTSLANQVRVLADASATKAAMREMPAAFDAALMTHEEDLAVRKKRLAEYYNSDFLQEYARRNKGNTVDMEPLLVRLSDTSANLQYEYIANNPHPLGEKLNLDAAVDNSHYSDLHRLLHPHMRNALQAFGFYDIFLVDPRSGRIVYTVYKELDFGTSLINGSWAKTPIGDAFRAANLLTEPGSITISEFDQYLPSYNDQAAFMATPIFDGSTKLGIFIVQIPIDKINAVMTQNKQWERSGLGASGETYLLAADYTPRSISRFAVEDMTKFTEALKQAGVPADIVTTISAKGSNIGLQKITTEGAKNAIDSNKTGFGIYPDYRNVQVLGAYTPLKVFNLNWAVLAEIDASEAFAPIAILQQNVWLWAGGITVILLALGLTLAFALLRAVTRPIARLRSTVTQVASGDYDARVGLKSQDEFGELGRAFDNLLNDRVGHLAAAQRENEELNDSVVLLLQAVARLASKDLTASAPVSNNVIGTVSDSINLLTQETGKVLLEVRTIAAQVKLTTERVKSQANLVNATATEERDVVAQAVEHLSNATRAMTKVTELALQSNETAEKASLSTNTALETVNQTVDGMESIRELIGEAEKRIKRLGERSQEISGIVNIINTISERTHVLALNASMQAAAAGDAGRGFAVVAEEVQRLAENARNATQQISQLVHAIQVETADTVNTVNHTIAKVVAGSEVAARSGQQMRETQAVTAQLVEMVRRISVGAQMQIKIANDLRARVQQLGASTEKTATEIALQAEATQALAASADNLVHSVSVFKLPAA